MWYRNWEIFEWYIYIEYKVIVWNCECSEIFYVCGLIGNVDVLFFGVFSFLENECVEIIMYYESYEMYIYNVVLNYFGMEVNGVIFEFLLMY